MRKALKNPESAARGQLFGFLIDLNKPHSTHEIGDAKIVERNGNAWEAAQRFRVQIERKNYRPLGEPSDRVLIGFHVMHRPKEAGDTVGVGEGVRSAAWCASSDEIEQGGSAEVPARRSARGPPESVPAALLNLLPDSLAWTGFGIVEPYLPRCWAAQANQYGGHGFLGLIALLWIPFAIVAAAEQAQTRAVGQDARGAATALHEIGQRSQGYQER